MSGEATTIARPYAEAVFARAVETDKLALWSDMLALLSGVVQDPTMAALVAEPKLDRDEMAGLLIEIGGGRLTEEGKNLVRILVENDRLALIPEIAGMFELRKSEHEGAIDVTVESAFDVKPAEQRALAAALSAKLGREIRLTSVTDPELVGGVRIRAGDLVIDGSIQGRLQQLAHELGI
jgi:F-type H+-transporting ATPase subunit delta